MKHSSLAHRRPRERGQLSWVTAVMILGVAAAGYLGWVWIPIGILHYEVKQVVRDYMNQAVRNRDDARLIANMVAKIRTLDERRERQANGDLLRIPVVDLVPNDVTWERDTSIKPPTLHVSFEYAREVVFPVLDLAREFTMTVDLTQEIDVPDWGASR